MTSWHEPTQWITSTLWGNPRLTVRYHEIGPSAVLLFRRLSNFRAIYYIGAIMTAMASQTTSVSNAYSTVCSGVDQRKLQSSPSLTFFGGIHRWPVNILHKGPVTQKMLPFDDVIMNQLFDRILCLRIFAKSYDSLTVLPFVSPKSGPSCYHAECQTWMFFGA